MGRQRRWAVARAFATFLAGACLPGGQADAVPPAARAPEAFLWPLPIPGVLLSSFGEYRYDHLHAGIDISTQGGTGYRVLAADDGVIVRLKVEWRGYGRALYMRHPSGLMTVYGHLERFEDAVLKLERRVSSRQAEAKTRYPGDIYLDPPLPVRRGQVIGFSGESGVGLPHLHFEVRDAEDRPVDPFVAGLRLPEDRRPPILESVTLYPSERSSRIDGRLGERTVPLRRRNGLFVGAAPLRIDGGFVAVLSAYDPIGAGGRSGIHGLLASLEGCSIYALTLQSFRFDQYPQSGLIYDHALSHLGPSKYGYRLIRLAGNDLAASQAGGDGGERALRLGDGPGSHLLEIEARDEAGNVSRGRLELVPDRLDARVPASNPTPSSRAAMPPFLVGWPQFIQVLLPRSLTSDPSPRVESSATHEILAHFLPGEDDLLSATFDYPAAAMQSVTVVTSAEPRQEIVRLDAACRMITRAAGGTLTAGNAEISLAPGSRFADGPIVARRFAAQPPEGLVEIGPALELSPGAEALDKPATLTFHLETAGLDRLQSLGIYRFDSMTGRWGYEGGELDTSARVLSLRFRRYGRFALLEDASPPVVAETRPLPGARDVERRPRFLARIDEVGMGLDFDGVRFELDGTILEAEFDPDHGQSQVLEPPTLQPGRHRLRVTAIDRAGNASAPVEVPFEVR